jgi:hypothetical protein
LHSLLQRSIRCFPEVMAEFGEEIEAFCKCQICGW